MVYSEELLNSSRFFSTQFLATAVVGFLTLASLTACDSRGGADVMAKVNGHKILKADVEKLVK